MIKNDLQTGWRLAWIFTSFEFSLEAINNLIGLLGSLAITFFVTIPIILIIIFIIVPHNHQIEINRCKTMISENRWIDWDRSGCHMIYAPFDWQEHVKKARNQEYLRSQMKYQRELEKQQIETDALDKIGPNEVGQYLQQSDLERHMSPVILKRYHELLKN